MRKRSRKKRRVRVVSIKRVVGAFNLPIQTATLVPSTTQKKKAISSKAFQRRINETRRFLSGLFGGYTSVQGIGGYLSKKSLIREKVAVVTAYAHRSAYLRYKNRWIAWVRSKKREWGQESMGIIIENDLKYI